MNKYKITYDEDNVINKTITIEANSVKEALTIFLTGNPSAVYNRIEIIEL